MSDDEHSAKNEAPAPGSTRISLCPGNCALVFACYEDYTDVMSMNAVELRPRSTTEVLGLSFDLYRKNFPLFLGIAALVMAPILLLTTISQLLPLAQLVLAPESMDAASGELGGAFIAFTLASYCLGGIALLLGVFWPWMEGALTSNVIERMLGREPGLGQSYREARPRWGALWGSNILAQLGINAPWVLVYILLLVAIFFGAAFGTMSEDGGALIAGLLAVLCVPVLLIGIVITVVLAINWTFRAPAIMGEGADGVGALSRSNALVKGDRLRIFGRYLLLGVIEFVLIGLPVLVVSVLLALVSFPSLDSAAAIDRAVLPGVMLFSVMAAGVSFFGTLLLSPLRIIFTTVNYIDLRVRKENLAQTVAGLPIEPATPAPFAAVAPIAPVVASAPTPAAPATVATAPEMPPAAPQPPPPEKIGIGIPANVDMSTLSPGQRIGVLFNRIRNEGASPALLNDLGMAYMDIGDTGGAMDAFNRARELDPNDADVAYNLMLLAMQRKDMAGAKAMMREYLRLETNAADAERVRTDPRFKDVLPE